MDAPSRPQEAAPAENERARYFRPAPPANWKGGHIESQQMDLTNFNTFFPSRYSFNFFTALLLLSDEFFIQIINTD